MRAAKLIRPSTAGIEQAAQSLRAGGLVAFPTGEYRRNARLGTY